ncbi:MAG: membrane protein insertion efficiency factor YidD [bacterium]
MKKTSLTSILLLITLLHGAAYSSAQDIQMETSVPKWVGERAIYLFQKYISSIDGRDCNFYPTCSEYGVQCVKKWGLLRGVVMTSGRLQRCHSCTGTDQYPYQKKGRLWDPPEENNFW